MKFSTVFTSTFLSLIFLYSVSANALKHRSEFELTFDTFDMEGNEFDISHFADIHSSGSGSGSGSGLIPEIYSPSPMSSSTTTPLATKSVSTSSSPSATSSPAVNNLNGNVPGSASLVKFSSAVLLLSTTSALFLML